MGFIGSWENGQNNVGKRDLALNFTGDRGKQTPSGNREKVSLSLDVSVLYIMQDNSPAISLYFITGKKIVCMVLLTLRTPWWNCYRTATASELL